MRKMKALATTASLAAAAMLLAACGGGTSGAPEGGSPEGNKDLNAAIKAVTADELKGTTITMSRMFGDCEETTQGVTDTAKATSECEAIQILTNKFNAENEFGIKIERLGGSDWNSYYDAFNASIAGGEPADVANLHDYALSDYAKRGQLLSFNPADFGIEMSDATAQAQKSVQYDGSTYAVPFDSHALLWHVNTDILEQAGYMKDGKPVSPTSPEEFLQMAKDVKEKTGKYIMSVGVANDDMLWRTFFTFVAQQGGALLNEDGSANVNSAEAKKALEFINQLIEGEYIHTNADYAGSIDEWKNEKSAILANGTWAVNEYAATSTFGYTVVDFPTVFNQSAAWASSHMWVMPTQKDNDPVQYRAAIEFAKYLYNNTDTWSLATGHFSPRVSVINSDAYLNAPLRSNYTETALKNITFVPQVDNWTAIKSLIHTQLEEVWFNGKAIDAALTEAQSRVEQQTK
ncbi:type 2 periplasmic-binding domain-containing protein [Timonella senegalensis]|uniref:hypothetical protein n=1 Tax=Timonella senegalensis TaxID=1465825 RepID=UPI0002D92C8A|nr:hypothetical protein [Timonella senegalensis]